MLYSVLDAFVIDTEAVDYCLVSRNTEATRLRIAVLRLWSQGTDLTNPNPKFAMSL